MEMMFSKMWFIPVIMMILCCGGFMFRKNIFSNRREDDSYEESNNEPTPLEILKTRYAKGEITKSEYDSMKHEL